MVERNEWRLMPSGRASSNIDYDGHILLNGGFGSSVVKKKKKIKVLIVPWFV